MNRPPLLLHLRIPTSDGSFGLWLPWFLIYPILLALMLIALPIVLVAVLILLPTGKARPLIMGGPYLWRILFSMRGLNVDINDGPKRMTFNFI
ncbi:MAG: hypothetical protein P3T54_05310 [Dehalogenimonas sp.]|uniref:Uncharacterized protein n=1 Tax=Candidatus Dehalogenimonas loeffleri TaxID=3127115 RepID=A0ABZ2J271_9CHLR|nr:hypothetical protein [Dehalogenimonas sp.]